MRRRLSGTCREIGKQDVLYMEVNVLTSGKLKDGKIQIGGENYYLHTILPKDDELKNNYIGYNTKLIEFNEIANGTQKMLFGIVRSGNYSYDSTKASAIGNNINNYSKTTTIVFTGTYVNEQNEEIEVRKEVPLQVDWYGNVTTYISNLSQINYNLPDRLDEANQTINLSFSVNTEETAKKLLLKQNVVNGTIPQLDGYDPAEVTCSSSNVDFTYDEETRTFTLTRTSTTDENGNITSGIGRSNSYTINVKYPLEAYTGLDSQSVVIQIPVEEYYLGYNNQNTEFSNPYKSNIAKSTIVASFSNPREQAPSIDIKVGKYMTSPTRRYVVSKKKPIRIYNELSTEEKDDTYQVSWYAYTGTNGATTGATFKETENTTDEFIKTDSSTESMNNVTTNIGIGFSGATNFIGEDGWIKVYDDETGYLLAMFENKEWEKYTSSSPYYYETAVKHIRVETSATNAGSNITIYNIKELDDTEITESYTREEFDNLQFIKSNLNVTLGDQYNANANHRAYYEAPYSLATISLSNNTISTQQTEEHDNIIITANAAESQNQVGWTNGSFLVTLPEEIIDIEINSVNINNSSVKITSYELIEKDGTKLIKINTENKTETPQSYTITIDCNLSPDPRIATTHKSLELYATNEETDDYYYKAEDTYDVDDDLNTQEQVNKTSCSISMIAPNSLLISQTATDFDDKNTLIVSPQIADVRPQYAEVDGTENTAKIGIHLKNNYSSDISEIALIGIIPFEGNKYVISNKDMASEFTTTMTNQGVKIPEELEGKVTVYYSTNEHPTKDLDVEENGWTLAENVENWDNIKTFMVDFQDYVLEASKTLLFEYQVNIPDGIDFNKLTYSEAGVYFSLHTESGKYRTKTEPNKLGFRIAEKYAIELIKYQTGKDKLVPGATYLIIKEGDEEGKTATTNENGRLSIKNLYAEETYCISEIKTPADYELNDEVIKFIAHINKQTGTLTIEKLSGTIIDINDTRVTTYLMDPANAVGECRSHSRSDNRPAIPNRQTTSQPAKQKTLITPATYS